MKNKLPTIKEIAQRLSVSVSTVSRALNDHPKIGLRTKMQVQKLARELNYEPNQTAIFFKQGKTHTIGVILPNLKEDFFSEAINGIEDHARTKSYNVLIGQSHDDTELEKNIVHAMKNHRVDGLIISISKHTKSYDHFTALEKYGIPVVFFDRVPDHPNFHRVSFNFNTSTKLIVEYLVKQGHRRIGVINGPEEMKSSRERTKIYMDVLQRKRIKIDLSLVVNTDFTTDSTVAAMKDLLERKHPPTAILTIHDYVALDAMHYARQQNIVVNKDVLFVSYANLPINRYLEYPPMVSIEQYPYEQAKKAAEILFSVLDRGEGDAGETSYQNVLIEGTLVTNRK